MAVAYFFAWHALAHGTSLDENPTEPSNYSAQDLQGTIAEEEEGGVQLGPRTVFISGLGNSRVTGEHTTEQLLRNIPLTNANGIPVSNNAGAPTRGASGISFRGMDPDNTLVLINGRRVAPYPVGSAFTHSFVDLYSIPLAAIQNVNILRNGSTVLYGANAVAGTVDLELRHHYRGAQVSVEYGNTLDKDSSEFSSAIIFGVGDEKTNVTGVINYYHRNSIFNRDRGGISSKPLFLSTNSSPQNLQLNRDVVIAAGVPEALLPGGVGGPTTFFGHAPFLGNGFAAATDYIYSGGRTSLFNFNAFQGSFPESERWGGYVNAEHKICGDQVVLYADMLYQNVKTHNELAPAPSGNFQTAGQTTIAIPPNAPGAEPPGTPTHAETGVPADAFNAFNPFQQIISGGSRLRTVEFDNRLFDNETDAILFTAGLKGDKLFDGTWGYDTAFRFSQIKNTETHTGVSASRFNRILNAADPIFDPTSSQFIGTTIPFNPFGDFRVIPSNAPSIDYATVHPNRADISKLLTVDFNVYTTDLFKLPAGGVGLAVGAQFRRDTISQKPDSLTLSDDLIGALPILDIGSTIVGPDPFTNGERETYAVYAEIKLPIFSRENAIAGFHALELNAAGRFEAWTNNDTNAAVPKVGLRWQPFDDSFTIRGTWQKGFREPSLYELFSSSAMSVGFPPPAPVEPFDPRFPVVFSSNPNLQPEDSHALNAGIEYKPKFVPGLTLAVDFWSIERTGVVQLPDVNSVLAREFRGILLPGEFVERDLAGNISGMGIAFQNTGQARSRGIDFGIQYQYQSPFGTFTSLTQVTYLDSFRLQLTSFETVPSAAPTLEVVETPVGQITGLGTGFMASTADDAYLKWKGRSSLEWRWNNFDILATVNYLSGFHEILFTASFLPDDKKEHWVKATWTVDVQGTYDFVFSSPVESRPVAGYSKDPKEMARAKDGKAMETTQTANYSMPCWKNLVNNTSITVGCNNVFGQDPPLAFGGFGNTTGYPGAIYDSVGRFVYVQLRKTF